MVDLKDIPIIGEPKERKYAQFKNIIKLKGHTEPRDYYLQLCDEAIGAGLMTREEFQTITGRYNRLPIHNLIKITEQMILNKIKLHSEEDYWKRKNHEANTSPDSQLLDAAINANSTKANK